MKKTCLALLLCGLISTSSQALMMEASGEAAIPVGSAANIMELQTSAKKEALVDAMIYAINSVNWNDVDAGSPEVREKLRKAINQLDQPGKVKAQFSQQGSNFVAKVNLKIDDVQFRKILSDLRIDTGSAKARSYPIFFVMDEFILPSPDPTKIPVLKELTEFSSSKGASFKDQSSDASDKRSASSSAVAASSELDASASRSSSASGSGTSSAAVTNGYGSGAASSSSNFSGNSSSSGSLHSKDAIAASKQSASSSQEVHKKDVFAETHDDVKFKKLIEYAPPKTAPEKTSMVYASIKGSLGSAYDLVVMDDALIKSAFTKKEPLTLEKLMNGPELKKYADFAQSQKAAFFLAGTTVIYVSDQANAAGERVCSGYVTLRSFSLLGGSESIGDGMFKDEASGRDSASCEQALATKLSEKAGPEIGSAIRSYWRKRMDEGKQYVLILQGKPSLGVRAKFNAALKQLSGINLAGGRDPEQTERGYTVYITYKGSAAIDEALAEKLMSFPEFASLDSINHGTEVEFCLSTCAKPAKKK